MPRVKLLHRWATPEFNHPEGAEVDVDEAQARQLVDGLSAEPIDPIPPAPAEQGKPGRGRRRAAPLDPSSPAPPPATAETTPETEATTEAE